MLQTTYLTHNDIEIDNVKAGAIIQVQDKESEFESKCKWNENRRINMMTCKRYEKKQEKDKIIVSCENKSSSKEIKQDDEQRRYCTCERARQRENIRTSKP